MKEGVTVTVWPYMSRVASRIVLLFALVLSCLGAVQAQAPVPSPSPTSSPQGPLFTTPPAVPPGDTMVILYLTPEGEWNRALQEAWDGQGAVAMPSGVRPLAWTQLLPAPTASLLTPAQRDQVLRFPQMLVDSARRQDLLSARYVVLAFTVKPDEPRMVPLVVDVRTGAQQWLGMVKASERSRMPAALGKSLQDSVTRMGSRVWGNVAGKQYHVVGCDHVRKDQVITIDSEREARENAYEACALCFPDPRVRNRNNTEMALGREIAGYIERRYRIDSNAERQARVDRVGRSIVENNGLRTFDYVFRVVDSDAPNAFAAGAGYVFVTRGMEKVTAGNDDMLATVMGHEIAHTEEHHVLRQYRQAQQWAVLGALISIATRTNLGGLLADFAGGLISRGHSRRFEVDADRSGVLFAYGAGYRPQDFELVLNALKKLGGGKAPDWLRTHPTEERRIALVRQLMAQLDGLDATVRGLSLMDPAMGAYIRRRAATLVGKREMVEGLVAPLRLVFQVGGPGAAAVGPARPASPAPTVTASPEPPSPPQSGQHDDAVPTPKVQSPTTARSGSASEAPPVTPQGPAGTPSPRVPGTPPEDD